MRMRTALGLVVFTSMTGLVACGGSVKGNNDEPVDSGRAALKRAMSCDDLLSMLQADAIAKENVRIDAMIADFTSYGPQRGGADPVFDDDLAGAPGAPESPNAGDADSGGGGGSGGGGFGSDGAGEEQASDYSDTNTQVEGVDEADIVKTDGKYIYLVHGGRFAVLKAWPATELSEASSIEIDGEPIEMFVEEGRALVYSIVNGDPIYEAAGVEPRDQYGYGGYGSGPAVDVGMPEPADVGPGGYPEAYARTRLLKITVLNLEGTQPTLAAEHWFEGDYRSSRRVGAKVRTVIQGGDHGPILQHWPNEPLDGSVGAFKAAFERLRSENIARIAATTLEDWLPYEMHRQGDAIVADMPRCEDFYVPTAGTTEHGLVQIKSLDWTAPTEVNGINIVGRADQIYANESTMYLAATAWSSGYVYQAWMSLLPGLTDPIAVPIARTHVHKLDLTINPNEPTYVASGTVTGTVLDQFSLDERNGYLRIATTEDRMILTPRDNGTSVGGDVPVGAEPGTINGGGSGGGSGGDPFPGRDEDAGSAEPLPDDAADGGSDVPEGIDPAKSAASIRTLSTPWPPSRVNRLYVLEQQGDHLATIGDVGELAPDERIYSARFVGDKGYLVTFRQVDPLFAIDLSQPTQPKVLGELKIPGFSNYMHPIDDGHLLTIGQDAGVTNGLSVQLFDVTDPVHPTLKSKYVFEAAWGSSEAQYNHKAFTWYASRKLLAFPYVGYTADYSSMRSSLELISVDVATGVKPFGSIDHSAFFEDVPYGYCGGYYGINVRRGVFLDDVVYSISYGGVMAHDLADLETPLASLPLPAPSSGYTDCGYYE